MCDAYHCSSQPWSRPCFPPSGSRRCVRVLSPARGVIQIAAGKVVSQLFQFIIKTLTSEIINSPGNHCEPTLKK